MILSLLSILQVISFVSFSFEAIYTFLGSNKVSELVCYALVVAARFVFGVLCNFVRIMKIPSL